MALKGAPRKHLEKSHFLPRKGQRMASQSIPPPPLSCITPPPIDFGPPDDDGGSLNGVLDEDDEEEDHSEELPSFGDEGEQSR